MYEPFDPRRQRLNLKYTSEHVHIFLNPIIQRKYSKIMYLHNHKSYGPVRKRGGGGSQPKQVIFQKKAKEAECSETEKYAKVICDIFARVSVQNLEMFPHHFHKIFKVFFLQNRFFFKYTFQTILDLLICISKNYKKTLNFFPQKNGFLSYGGGGHYLSLQLGEVAAFLEMYLPYEPQCLTACPKKICPNYEMSEFSVNVVFLKLRLPSPFYNLRSQEFSGQIRGLFIEIQRFQIWWGCQIPSLLSFKRGCNVYPSYSKWHHQNIFGPR